MGQILEYGLLQFIEKTFPDGYRFSVQDNDPKHTSVVTKAYMQEKKSI